MELRAYYLYIMHGVYLVSVRQTSLNEDTICIWTQLDESLFDKYD